jgi:glutathione peroxidase
MKILSLGLGLILGMGAANGGFAMNVYDFKVKDINGKEAALSQYSGKVALVVNTASECGFTSQYAGLQEVFEKYKAKGLVVLAFPSNDFGAQEPGTDQEIAKFCDLRFKVKFPLFSKIAVKGKDQAPIYQHLIAQSPVEKGKDVSWNFEKFLVNQKGEVVGRFKSKVEPTSQELISAIESQLTK